MKEAVLPDSEQMTPSDQVAVTRVPGVKNKCTTPYDVDDDDLKEEKKDRTLSSTLFLG